MTIQEALRMTGRLIPLVAIIAVGFLAYPVFLLRSVHNLLLGKIAWMQWMSRRFLWLLGCQVYLRGSVPHQGLIVSNHLGYVDILVIGSVCPGIFVAKSDVKAWPIFGSLAALSGTLFVSRDTPTKVMDQIEGISSLLAGENPIVLFPEGTSSDGTQVLPFRSSLLQAAFATGKTITPTAIRYTMSDGANPRASVSYWGTMSFFPHLLTLMANASFSAQLSFGKARIPSLDRKQEACLLHAEVSALLDD